MRASLIYPPMRAIKYLWAAPYTLLGVALGTLALALGGSLRVQGGVMEFVGGALGRRLERLPAPLAFSAVTLGHVIIAADRSALTQLRQHEHVHVRQYERWGVLFVPAYLVSSLVQLVRGRDPYRENHFERQAYAVGPMKKHSHG
jgi:hypothetical protein